jgi:HEAT repeat protein
MSVSFPPLSGSGERHYTKSSYHSRVTEDVRRLLETALFDSGGETVEGAFVDRWEAHRWGAVERLSALFSSRGFTDADLAILQELLRRKPEPVATFELLSGLHRWLAPFRGELEECASISLRKAALMAGASDLSLPEIAAFLGDPTPSVRMAAIDALLPHRFKPEERSPLLIGALEDPDPAVRAHAARHTPFLEHPPGAEALARRYDLEPDAGVKRAILERVSEEAYRTGKQVARGRVGDRLVGLLRRELDHEDPAVRRIAARGLERVSGDDVGNALLDRLAVETARDVTLALLAYGSYARYGDRAFLLLETRLRESDAPTRVAACWRLEDFPAEQVVPLLRRLISDPDVGRPAIMVLGRMRDPSVLPAIVERLSDPAAREVRQEIRNAIDSLMVHASFNDPAPTPELSGWIRSRIDALEGGKAGQRHRVLPLHESSARRLWSLRPDGSLLVSDLDAVRNAPRLVEDPLTRFVMLLRGSRAMPELAVLLVPPKEACVCNDCLATGRSGEVDCGRCRGLGWVLR